MTKGRNENGKKLGNILAIICAFMLLCGCTKSENNSSENSMDNSVSLDSTNSPDSTNSSDTLPENSDEISSVTSSKPEPQPVDIENGMTLTGTPIDNSQLEEFLIEPYYSDWEWNEGEEEFLDSLEVPEIKDLHKRALCMTSLLRSQRFIRFTSAAVENDRKPSCINRVNNKGQTLQYIETGYTYESLYSEYLRTFTKETLEEMFKEYDVFLNYNDALFFQDAARGEWLGEVHREYELISKSNTVIEYRLITFHKDSEDKPAAEYVPELRDEYGIGVTDFRFVLTEDGWRIANLPVEAESSDISSEEEPHQSESPFYAGGVYPDDELVPSEWIHVDSIAEVMEKVDEIIKSDTSAKDPEIALPALMNKNVVFNLMILSVSSLFDINWDAPYNSADFENPIYPFTTEYFSDVQSIYDFAYQPYECSYVEEHFLFGTADNPKKLFAEENGQMYINTASFPAGLGGGPPAFITRSYVEITEKTDNKCTFIWHYPDVEELNPPKDGYEFFYFKKTYTAEYIDGSWKLNKMVINT